MVPALGVTEPGAISFCVAKAKSYAKGELLHLNVAMNSGMYKNAFTCGIPNSKEVGNVLPLPLDMLPGILIRAWSLWQMLRLPTMSVRKGLLMRGKSPWHLAEFPAVFLWKQLWKQQKARFFLRFVTHIPISRRL